MNWCRKSAQAIPDCYIKICIDVGLHGWFDLRWYPGNICKITIYIRVAYVRVLYYAYEHALPFGMPSLHRTCGVGAPGIKC
jgi:hypothetical protein